MNEPDPTQIAEPSLVDRLLMVLPSQLRPLHIAFYRATNGLLVDRLTWGAPLLLLTTIGRVTGHERTVIVGYLETGDDLILVGTNGGSSKPPAWVGNLRAHPHANVNLKGERFPARAEFIDEAERYGYWQALVQEYPTYDYSERRSGRAYPLVRLVKVSAT